MERISAIRLRLAAIGWRLSAGGYRLAAIGWQLAAGGYRLAAIGWQLSAGSWRLAAIGWQLSAGSWRSAEIDKQRAHDNNRFVCFAYPAAHPPRQRKSSASRVIGGPLSRMLRQGGACKTNEAPRSHSSHSMLSPRRDRSWIPSSAGIETSVHNCVAHSAVCRSTWLKVSARAVATLGSGFIPRTARCARLERPSALPFPGATFRKQPQNLPSKDSTALGGGSSVSCVRSCLIFHLRRSTDRRKPQAASRKPQAASRKPQAASRFQLAGWIKNDFS